MSDISKGLKRTWKRHGRAAVAATTAAGAGVAAGKALTDRKTDRNWARGKERVKNSLVTGAAAGTLGQMLDGGKSGFRGARIGAAVGALAGLLHDPKRRPRTATAIHEGGDWDFSAEGESEVMTFELLRPGTSATKVAAPWIPRRSAALPALALTRFDEGDERHEKRVKQARDGLSVVRDAAGVAAGIGTTVAATRITRHAKAKLDEALPWAKRVWKRDVKRPVGALLQRWRKTAKDVSGVASGIGRDVRVASENVGTLKSVGELGEQAKKFFNGPAAVESGQAVGKTGVGRRVLRWAATRLFGDTRRVTQFARENREESGPGVAGTAATGAGAGALVGAHHLPGREMRTGENLTGKRLVRRTPWPFVQHEGIGVGRGRVMEVRHRGLNDPDARTHIVDGVQRWSKGRRFKVLDDEGSNAAGRRAKAMSGHKHNYCLWGDNCQHVTEAARTGKRPTVSRQWRQIGTGAAAGGVLAGITAAGVSAWRKRAEENRRLKSPLLDGADRSPTQFARGDYLDDQGRHVSAWDVFTGRKQAYHTKFDPTSGRHRVDIGSPRGASAIDAAGAVHSRAKAVARWGDRGTNLVRDAGDALKGAPRRRDASGRVQKREWEKPWAQRHAKELLATGGLLATGLVYRKHAGFRKAVDATRETVVNHARAIGNKIGFSVPKSQPMRYDGGRNAPAPWGERLQGPVEQLCEVMFARVFGGSAPEHSPIFGRRRSTALPVIAFDERAEEAGWDVRDPRGRSARVFSPGARPRERREKRWFEQVDNERKLWATGAGMAAAGGAAAAVATVKRWPKLAGLKAPGVTRQRVAKPKAKAPVQARPTVVPFPKAG